MTKASIKSMTSSIGGVVVLLLFSATFLTLDKVVFITPLFIAFTGAMNGFQLVASLRGEIQGQFIFPFVMGTGLGAAVFILVRIASLWAGSVLIPGFGALMIYMSVAGISSYLGARLAAGYFNL